MGDMHEAGRKAWATRQTNEARRVGDLHRKTFESTSKEAVRRRVIQVLLAGGATKVLDLWGGGRSAEEMTAVGLAVVSVENGDHGYQLGVSRAKTRHALELAAAEGGYEGRWGRAAQFASECDAAFLDFCGPWSAEVRRSVEACRHMKVVVVTLMTDHDIATDATRQAERRVMYEAVLRLATMETTRKTHGGLWRNSGWNSIRMLCQYRRPGGQPAWVFLLRPHRFPTGPNPRALTDPDALKRQTAKARERRQNDPTVMARHNAVALVAYHRRMTDPEKRAERNAKHRAYRARRKAAGLPRV